MTNQCMSVDKNKMIEQLKKEYMNDYCVLTDSVLFGISARVYSNKDIAIKEHRRITNNCELLKPCTVELINLW